MLIPRKALAAIVEHTGSVPEDGGAVVVRKGMEPQTVMEEAAKQELAG